MMMKFNDGKTPILENVKIGVKIKRDILINYEFFFLKDKTTRHDSFIKKIEITDHIYFTLTYAYLIIFHN